MFFKRLNRICRFKLITTLYLAVMLLPVSAFASDPDISPPPPGSCRILSWNIELVGKRNPPRTDEQLAALANRIAGFNASLLVLQEIYDLQILQHIVDRIPGNWNIFYPGNEHAIVYDPNHLQLLSGSIIDSQSPYPGKSSSVPATAMFRSMQTHSEPFRVISIHCKANSPSTQTDEGLWIADHVAQLLENPNEPTDIIVIGDTNGEPDAPPDTQLQSNNLLFRLPNEDITDTRDRCVDHCYATNTAYEKFPAQTATIISPQMYNESNTRFRNTYSDHYPLIVDFKPIPQTKMKAFARLAKHWLQTQCNEQNIFCNTADKNTDGQVNTRDLTEFIRLYIQH